MLKKLLDIIVYTSLWISLAAVAMTVVTYQMIGETIRWDALMLLIFGATMATYCLARVVGVRQMPDAIRKRYWFAQNRKIVWALLIVSSGLVGVCFFLLQFPLQITLILSAVITLLYSLPIFKYKGEWLRLRDVHFVKIFLIALIWGITTVILPLQNIGQSLLEPASLLLILERILFIFAITLPFDIRDILVDKEVNLKTIPHVIGLKASRQLAYGIILFLILLTAYRMFLLVEIPMWTVFIPALLVYLLSIALIYRSSPQLPDLYYTFGVDGLMVIWGILSYFFSHLLGHL